MAKDLKKSEAIKQGMRNLTPAAIAKQAAHLNAIRAKSIPGLIARFTIEPPENVFEIIRQASENGCTTKQIAEACGVSSDTFNRWCTNHPDIAAAYREGRKENMTCLSVVFIVPR